MTTYVEEFMNDDCIDDRDYEEYGVTEDMDASEDYEATIEAIQDLRLTIKDIAQQSKDIVQRHLTPEDIEELEKKRESLEMCVDTDDFEEGCDTLTHNIDSLENLIDKMSTVLSEYTATVEQHEMMYQTASHFTECYDTIMETVDALEDIYYDEDIVMDDDDIDEIVENLHEQVNRATDMASDLPSILTKISSQESVPTL